MALLKMAVSIPHRAARTIQRAWREERRDLLELLLLAGGDEEIIRPKRAFDTIAAEAQALHASDPSYSTDREVIL